MKYCYLSDKFSPFVVSAILLVQIFLSFVTHKQLNIKLKPRTKLNHNIWNSTVSNIKICRY